MIGSDMPAGIAEYTRRNQLEHARPRSEREEADLRAAYSRTELPRRMSFEQAIAVPALAAALRAMAHALHHTPGELPLGAPPAEAGPR